MNQTFVPKLNQTLKQNFNRTNANSLQILACNHEQLKVYLQEQVSQNPYLHCPTIAKETDADAYLSYAQEKKSLYEEIMNQASLSKHHPDPRICEYLIFQLDGNGYFKINYKTLLRQSPYDTATLKRHLAILRSFEPHGLFSFTLKQCLKLQCRYSMRPESETAYLLCDYLEDLALHHYDNILKACELSLEELEEGYRFLKTLNPKPGANYQTDIIYLQPEFLITVENEEIKIQLLHDDLKLSFDPIDHSIESKELQAFMRKQRQQAQDLMNGIKRRNMTLLQIMQYICDIQKDFFLHQGMLQHLTLSMIAENCGFHISTVSRAIANKSFEFEHQYHTLSSMLTHGGCASCSSQELKQKIKEIIAKEDKTRPFSDEQIRQILEEQKISISRRAVANYRESCFIYNSVKRKQNKQ